MELWHRNNDQISRMSCGISAPRVEGSWWSSGMAPYLAGPRAWVRGTTVIKGGFSRNEGITRNFSILTHSGSNEAGASHTIMQPEWLNLGMSEREKCRYPVYRRAEQKALVRASSHDTEKLENSVQSFGLQLLHKEATLLSLSCDSESSIMCPRHILTLP